MIYHSSLGRDVREGKPASPGGLADCKEAYKKRGCEHEIHDR
jgi:hypothetical protein